MSYILDALKRSERDRRLQRGPVSRSIHDDVMAPSPSRPLRLLLFGAGAIALLLTAGAVAYLLLPLPQHRQTATSAVVATVEVPVVPVQTGVQVEPAAPTSASGIVELWELGPAEQAYLRGFDISMHIYSPDPTQRAIVFNGQRVAEGQTLAADLRLRQITADGVVVELQGKAVRLPVDMGW